MKRTLILALLAAIPFTLSGCGGGNKDKDHKDEHKDHKHEKDDAHKDHKHEKDGAHKDHGHEGEPVVVGKGKAGDYEIEVTQIGKVEKGEGVLEVKVGGLAKGAATVRAWAGDAEAKGAVKAKGTYIADEDAFDIHVETADPLPAGAKWWIEVEPTGGKAVTASFDIKK